MELQGKPELTEAEKADLYRLETDWSNHWLADRDDIPSRAAGPQFTEGSDVVEAQRAKLYRIEGALRCVCDALNAESPDAEAAAGAIELAADEVERVNVALDRVNLLRAAREGTVDELRAASEAAGGAQS
jgi:hypothetical protein